MKQAAKRTKVKEIPADASGVVGANELADMLGVSYMTVYGWTKSGRILALPESGRRKKYDIAAVRTALADGKAPAVPIKQHEEVRASKESEQSQDEKAEESTRTEGLTAPAESPCAAAFKAYRLALRRQIEVARSAKNERGELALLRRVVGLNFKKFEQAIEGIAL